MLSNLWMYICGALVIVCIGLSVTIWLQSGKIDRLTTTVAQQEITIKSQEATIAKKEDDIKNLQELTKKNEENLKEAQKRMSQILSISNSFGKSVPITPAAPIPLGVVQMKDSARVVDWINKEILK